MFRSIRSFAEDRRGATAIEYTIIAGLMTVAIVAGLTLISGNLATMLAAIADSM